MGDRSYKFSTLTSSLLEFNISSLAWSHRKTVHGWSKYQKLNYNNNNYNVIRGSVSVDDRSETYKKTNRGINCWNIMDQILILVEFHSDTIASIFSGDVGDISSGSFTISLRDNEINQNKWEHIVADDRNLYYHGSR